jgi:hypothetical protein
VLLLSNAVGLLVAAAVLDDMTVDAQGFIIDVLIFTVVVALMTPFSGARCVEATQDRPPSAGWR